MFEMGKRTWTQSEDEYLRKNSNKEIWLSASELSRVLGRNPSAIRAHREILYLHPTGEQWTEVTKHREKHQMTVICQICKTSFKTCWSNIKRKYCSNECRAKGITETFKKKNSELIEQYRSQIGDLVIQKKTDLEISILLGLSVSRVTKIRKELKFYKSSSGGKQISLRKKTGTCKNCGRVFKYGTGEKEKKFCSDGCWRDWKHRKATLFTKEERICKGCGNTFLAFPRELQVYCSSACHNESQKSEKITKECEECKSSFKVPKGRESQRFCSRKCLYVFLSKQKEKNILEKKCEICGKSFRGKCPSVTKKRRFCSKECAIQFSKKNLGTRKVSVCLHMDEEQVKHLKSQKSEAGYIRKLVEEDMKKNAKD